MNRPIEKYTTETGRCIYRFQVQAFPPLLANIYVISDGQFWLLVDTGSGMDESNRDLLAGIDGIAEVFGEPIDLEHLDAILVTHAHIDHFGGLPFVREQSKAPIGVHKLDRRVLSHYEERVLVASRHLENFLLEAGVGLRQREKLMAMYLFAKDVYHSTPVEFFLDEEQPVFNGIEVIHVRGHCPGQVCLKVDDILLTADHVLARTTPHQAPESITHNMGLGHYLESLDKIAAVDGVRLALGGHEEPMADLYGRVQEIRQMHSERLELILDICSEPKSTAEISMALFGEAGGYHVLLALEEAGAHAEYLYQRGELVAANLDEIEHDPRPVIRYLRV